MCYNEGKLLERETAVKHKSIDDEIDNVLKFIEKYDPDSEEYGAAVHNLKELCEARSKKASRLVEVDTIVVCCTNILGIILILNYEQLSVVTSKALGILMKGRL